MTPAREEREGAQVWPSCRTGDHDACPCHWPVVVQGRRSEPGRPGLCACSCHDEELAP